jgi:hypothetical protein
MPTAMPRGVMASVAKMTPAINAAVRYTQVRDLFTELLTSAPVDACVGLPGLLLDEARSKSSEGH